MLPFTDRTYEVEVINPDPVIHWLHDRSDDLVRDDVFAEIIILNDQLTTEVQQRDQIDLKTYQTSYHHRCYLYGLKEVYGLDPQGKIAHYQAFIFTVLSAKDPNKFGRDEAESSVTFRELWLVPDEDGLIRRWIVPNRSH